MARSKEFDVQEVLDKALMLFWKQGYEKTSMSELVTHMGIHKRSMYDTFGDKHSLYMQVLDSYEDKTSAIIQQAAKNPDGAVAAIRTVFEKTVGKMEPEPIGCLMVNTAVELSLHDPEAAEKTRKSFGDTEALFLKLVREGQENGEIPLKLDATLISSYLNNAIIGLRVQSKNCLDKQKLNTIIDTTLSILKY